MKATKIIGTGIVILVAAGMLPATREQVKWVLASSRGTAQDYAAYLESWPIGRHCAEARSRFDELSWAESEKAGNMGSYQQYLKLHPQGTYASEAAILIEDLHWQQATNVNTTNSLHSYAKAYPTGRFFEEANFRIEELVWRQATDANTFESLRSYANRFPKGRFMNDAAERLEDLWWQKITNGNTISLYRAYAVAYPQGRFVVEARNREAILQQDDSPFAAALEKGTAKGIREFLIEFPGHARESYAQKVLAEITEGRDVVDLLAEKKVGIEMHGSGIKELSVRLRRLVPYPLTVRLPVGSYFVSSTASAQNMVATTERKVQLSTDRWEDISIPVACANRPKDIPNADVKFRVERSPYQAELARLMPVLDKANVNYATRQAAVWIVTDNASYDDLGTLVTRPAFSGFGGTRTINEEEAIRAIEICAEAGIEIRNKRIWRDWPTISRRRR